MRSDLSDIWPTPSLIRNKSPPHSLTLWISMHVSRLNVVKWVSTAVSACEGCGQKIFVLHGAYISAFDLYYQWTHVEKRLLMFIDDLNKETSFGNKYMLCWFCCRCQVAQMRWFLWFMVRAASWVQGKQNILLPIWFLFPQKRGIFTPATLIENQKNLCGRKLVLKQAKLKRIVQNIQPI